MLIYYVNTTSSSVVLLEIRIIPRFYELKEMFHQLLLAIQTSYRNRANISSASYHN